MYAITHTHRNCNKVTQLQQVLLNFDGSQVCSKVSPIQAQNFCWCLSQMEFEVGLRLGQPWRGRAVGGFAHGWEDRIDDRGSQDLEPTRRERCSPPTRI